MDNPYLLANRYIDIMPKVAEQVAKPLTAVDSIKMYGSGNAQKLVKETTSIVDQVASGLKDSTGIDLPSPAEWPDLEPRYRCRLRRELG